MIDMDVDVSKLRLCDIAAVVESRDVGMLDFFEVSDGRVTGVFSFHG